MIWVLLFFLTSFLSFFLPSLPLPIYSPHSLFEVYLTYDECSNFIWIDKGAVTCSLTLTTDLEGDKMKEGKREEERKKEGSGHGDYWLCLFVRCPSEKLQKSIKFQFFADWKWLFSVTNRLFVVNSGKATLKCWIDKTLKVCVHFVILYCIFLITAWVTGQIHLMSQLQQSVMAHFLQSKTRRNERNVFLSTLNIPENHTEVNFSSP